PASTPPPYFSAPLVLCSRLYAPAERGVSRGVSAPSIFGAPGFGRYVATHFFPDADLHGHRPAVLTRARPSWLSPARGPLFPPPGSSRFARAAYQRSPTRRAAVRPFAVRGRPRCSTSRCARAPAVLRDISAGTSYQAVRLVFRPYALLPGPICTSGPLRASAGASPAVALARRSSPPFGPRALHSFFAAACSPLPLPLRSGRPGLLLAGGARSLVRVSRRAAARPLPAALPVCFAAFHSAPAPLFSFPSRYFSSIGLLPSSAFDGSLHPSARPSRPAYSSPRARRYGALSLSGPAVLPLRFWGPGTPPPFRRGLRPFPSPVLRASVFVSFPPRTDMLKSRGFSRPSGPFKPRAPVSVRAVALSALFLVRTA
ncbi:hypothetical protein NEOKW01_1889, partial [Nematocida sp. AWRm80]